MISYSCLGCIEALAQKPILIRSANPSSKKVFPDDSIQLNRLHQARQLVGNNEEHYHKTPTLVDGRQMQGFSMSKTCAIEKRCVNILREKNNVRHVKLISQWNQ